MIPSNLRRIHLLWLAIGLLAISCSRAPKDVAAKSAGESAPPDRFSLATARDRYADDLGRFLAGLPARDGSQLADLEKQPAWIEHRRELDRAWSRIGEASLPAMTAFQKQELSAPAVVSAPVFYPFSGPDTLMATVFFPKNATYVLVGLEPAGTLPTAKQLARKDLAKYLSNVRATVDSELTRSFFITRQMDRQFRGQVTDGLFLPILELLVRSNSTILGYRYIRLDENGQVIERPADYTSTDKARSKGVEIDFRRDDDQSLHKLMYFSVNLSDTGLKLNQPFMAFLGSLKGTATMLKATSYMTHRPEFSMIRERVLAKSIAVLQDDSGIPFQYFPPAQWKTQLYGTYDRPYGSFRWFEQADLRKAYLEPGTKPLAFRIGYGFGKVPSNLLFARTVE
jgi:hypothetical protein